ncbi:hypothetical protein JCM8202v2_001789 [Rhodotorula sphaerocarpa]
MATVLILGGLGNQQDGARHLVPYLLSLPPAERPLFVRIVDRPLVIPAAGTRDKAFTLPAAFASRKGFDWVFDLTGERAYDTPDTVHAERTLRFAASLGASAVKHAAGSYVRVLGSCYRSRTPSANEAGEKENVYEPWGGQSSWRHEAARALATLEGLKLVLIRPGLLYGAATVTGITPRLAVGQVYHYEQEKLDLLWTGDLAQDTVHAEDLAAAMVHAARWAQSLETPRAMLDAHREDLPPSKQARAAKDALEITASAAPDAEKAVEAVVFSAVDDGKTTQLGVAKITEQNMEVTIGFQGKLVSSFVKLNLGDVADDVNEKHLDSWSDLLEAWSPRDSSNLPISPFIPVDLLGPDPISFDNSDLKRLTGWAPKYRLTGEVAKETVERFRKEGHWPPLLKRTA